MKPFKLIFLVLMSAAVFFITRQAAAQNASTTATLQTNGEYSLLATVGQPLIGVAQNASYLSRAGFVYALASKLASEEMQNAGNNLPTEYRLEQNYPNPFNPETTIGFALPQQAFVKLTLFDVLGREVARLVHKDLPAGEHRIILSAHHLPSGVYVYRMEANSFVQQKKLAVMK